MDVKSSRWFVVQKLEEFACKREAERYLSDVDKADKFTVIKGRKKDHEIINKQFVLIKSDIKDKE